MFACGAASTLPPELGRFPTKEEQQRIEAFAPRVIAAAREEGLRCAEVPIVMADMSHDDLRSMARPSRDPCSFYIQVEPRALRHLSPAELAGSLAHELGHVMNGDWTPERAGVPQIERERQADAVAIRVLKRMGIAECLAQVQHFQKIREQNIGAWGVEQRETATTHPSYTERIRTFLIGCRR
jgi:hypothetical protein